MIWTHDNTNVRGRDKVGLKPRESQDIGPSANPIRLDQLENLISRLSAGLSFPPISCYALDLPLGTHLPSFQGWLFSDSGKLQNASNPSRSRIHAKNTTQE